MGGYYPRALVVNISLLALVAVTKSYAQQPRMMLGAPDQVPDRFSAQYSIRYNDGGFSDPHPNKIRKSARYILNQGASEQVVAKFSGLALAMTGNANSFGDAIDRAWQARITDFNACGGVWAQAAREIAPSSLQITVEPTIWEYHPGVWVGGQTDNIQGLHIIRAINIYVMGIATNPSAADTIDFSAMVEWEIGNVLAD